MKKLMKILCFPILTLVMSGCYMPWEKDTDEQHLRYYEPITGKFVLHDNLDQVDIVEPHVVHCNVVDDGEILHVGLWCQIAGGTLCNLIEVE